jgi:hypothetical protein
VERACAADAGAIKQAAAIIQSEGVFIDSSPLGEAAASQANATDLVDIRIGARRVADIRTMICLRKSLCGALVETCSNYLESCDSRRGSLDLNSSADGFEHDWPQSSSHVQSRLG